MSSPAARGRRQIRRAGTFATIDQDRAKGVSEQNTQGSACVFLLSDYSVFLFPTSKGQQFATALCLPKCAFLKCSSQINYIAWHKRRKRIMLLSLRQRVACVVQALLPDLSHTLFFVEYNHLPRSALPKHVLH